MSDASARQAILGRIRQALAAKSSSPHWLHEPTGQGPIFPLPQPDVEATKGRFRDEFTAIQGEWHEAPTLEQGRAWLIDWLRRLEFVRIAAPDVSPLRRFWPGEHPIEWKNKAEEIAGWESIDLGVTTAESLVAESGSIVVSAGVAGRALSVLPPHHLVIATADQLVADLETSFARLRARYNGRLPSTASWITGPSRTADIEKILVLGAHGPRRLSLLCLPAGSLD